jgi:hypothetical protein
MVLMMEAVSPSETSVNVYVTSQHGETSQKIVIFKYKRNGKGC